MDAYCREIKKLEAKFYGLEFHHVPRDDNVVADALSKCWVFSIMNKSASERIPL